METYLKVYLGGNNNALQKSCKGIKERVTWRYLQQLGH